MVSTVAAVVVTFLGDTSLVAQGKEFTCNGRDIRDAGLISGLGRFPGGGHGNPLHYSCLENPMGTQEPGGLQSIGLHN